MKLPCGRQSGELKQSQSEASFHFCLFYQNLNLNLSKAALIRLMYSVANGAGSFEGWAESCHNDSHSFPLKGQLSQIEALWKESNLVKWANPCNSRSQHFRSCHTSEGTSCDFRAVNIAKIMAKNSFCWSLLKYRRTCEVLNLKNCKRMIEMTIHYKTWGGEHCRLQ